MTTNSQEPVNELDELLTELRSGTINFDAKAKAAIQALIADRERAARIDEIKNLLADEGDICVCQLADTKVCDHNWSLCNTIKERIAELQKEDIM